MTAVAASPDQDPRADWHERLDKHADEHGFHAYLSARHGALFTEGARTLLVSFEDAAAIRSRKDQLPWALDVAEAEGWSHLCLYAEGATWFRDQGVFALFDDLVDDGFFDRFSKVVFYGAGAGGYAAAAFSVAAPGASVLALQPQATLEPRLAGWDGRFRAARRIGFSGRYGFAPDMIEPAHDVVLMVDPWVREDAMHAALFARPNVRIFHAPHFGSDLADELDAMNALAPVLRALLRDELEAPFVAELLRRRRRHPAYLRRVLEHLEASKRPMLAARWCRAVLQFSGRARFQTGLAKAQDALAAQDRGLS